MRSKIVIYLALILIVLMPVTMPEVQAMPSSTTDEISQPDQASILEDYARIMNALNEGFCSPVYCLAFN